MEREGGWCERESVCAVESVSVFRTFTRKPTPDSGLDCLICAMFSWQRFTGEEMHNKCQDPMNACTVFSTTDVIHNRFEDGNFPNMWSKRPVDVPGDVSKADDPPVSYSRLMDFCITKL